MWYHIRMWRIYLIAGGAIAALVAISGLFAISQANNERIDLTSDLQYRTRVLSDSLQESIVPSFERHATSSVQKILGRIAGNERIASIVVFDSNGLIIASAGMATSSFASTTLVATAMDSAQDRGATVKGADGSVYVFASPIISEQSDVIGALLVAQNAQYIDDAILAIWLDNLQRLLALVIILGGALFVLVRWVFHAPLLRMVTTLEAIRRGDVREANVKGDGMLAPLVSEISKMTTSLRQARQSASEEARMRLEKLDSPWTAERLKEFIKAYLKDRPIFVVSNREPYVHTLTREGNEWSVPAGGVVTALEPVMAACGGTWIAHGSGSGDREASDEDGKLRVPPDEPAYTLKRVWLTDEEVKGYYEGFSNEAIWPLCHMAHTRPIFRAEDWDTYREVNAKFATTLLEEIRHVENPIVLVQDYHLALVPYIIKRARPDALVSIFWHIPWPSAAQFTICPWRREILMGMLGADIIGFHTQQYCNNFIDTVASELEARVDYEHFSVVRGEHTAFVKPFPISIAFPAAGTGIEKEPSRRILDELGIRAEKLILGVERLDYTKGILERFKALEYLFDTHPEYAGKATMLQIAAPSREAIPKYREYALAVEREAERINQRFATRDWKPIVLEVRSYTHAQLHDLYRLADVCIVSSLHDGMNLVAKEFVAARSDDEGVLVLSQFTGASRDLKGALIVNPYSAEETSEALHTALTMPKSDQYRRMSGLRASVRDYNVFRWSAEIIRALAQVR